MNSTIKTNRMNVAKTISIVLMLLCVIVILNEVYAAATTPTLINKLNTALKKILSYLEKLATPAAGVAIATGVMIRKLSFGDEEKLILGKRTIINAIVGYLIIQLIDLIIKFIEGIV